MIGILSPIWKDFTVPYFYGGGWLSGISMLTPSVKNVTTIVCIRIVKCYLEMSLELRLIPNFQLKIFLVKLRFSSDSPQQV